MGLFRKAALTVARGLGLTDRALVSWLAGESSHAGESVTVETALTLDAVWACARLVSQTIATLPLPLYERDGQGRSRVAPEHPLYRVLHDRPNAEMTAVEFWQALFACKLLWGTASPRSFAAPMIASWRSFRCGRIGCRSRAKSTVR
ncbi:hypothetical protein GCM10025880_27550 [Methylorubrum aminovorans]|nr:hypothetical protein GCM10025880_27550 [Methylorubrum aminovorans]